MNCRPFCILSCFFLTFAPMKQMRLIGFLLSFMALAACTKPLEPKAPVLVPDPVEGREGLTQMKLSAIDSLMWQRPDSALMLLLPCLDTCCVAEFDRHYANLLLAELLYKNDSAQTNRTQLQQAVVYFDSLLLADAPPTTAFLAARAHYINGVGHYEQSQVAEACTKYLKALETMENHFQEKDLIGKKARFMAYTYNRLGDLFSTQFMMEPAIACYEQSLMFGKISPTSPFGISNTLYRLGKQYDKLGNKEKAGEYYEQALEALPINQGPIYRDIVASKALCDYQLGSGMEQPMETLRHILAQATDDRERLTRHLTIGDIFFEEGLYDSALVYLEPVFMRNEDLTCQMQAANYLRIIYDGLDYVEKANECMRLLADQKKSEGENKALVSQLEGLFQDYLNQKQEQKATQEKREAVLRTVKILVPIALVVAVAVIVVSRKRGKKRLAEQQQAHRMEQAALAGRLKRSNQELRELKDRIQQNEESAPKPEAQTALFTEEPIYRLIMKRVNDGKFLSQMDCTLYKEYALDKAQVIALREAANRHFNQFTSRLAKAYPDLTKGDLDYCCLYLLGLNDADVAALLQKAYPTVSQRSRKLRAIFGSEVSLPTMLLGFANNNLLC